MSDSILPKKLGRYHLSKLIAKGGMGEVFLAHDPICDRFVALKKIRVEILKYKNSTLRFIQEAKIAARLTHPSIIAIFDIIQDEEHLYYTMPYIEGESLRDILYKTIENYKGGNPSHPIGGSIFSLAQIFLHVCQAIAFCHTKGVLHRDLKPGNIMIGEFGQVLILDWGLAKAINDTTKDEEFEEVTFTENEDLTRPGKAVGTLSYLAPERALGQPASIQSDIYSLGVVLYQLLTLRLPFKRQSLQDFRQTAKYEKLIDPIEMAPYRDIPLQLAAIAKKCLHFDAKDRYLSVEDLIDDLNNYIEGKPDWIFQSSISIEKSEDWEFQENILLNRQLAITRSSYMVEWVALMISKSSFSGNMKMMIEIETEKNSSGIGLLFSIPEKPERTGLEDGFCIWAGTKKNPGFKLFRSNVELLSFPEQVLKSGKKQELVIEKVDNRVKVILDGESVMHYIGYIPIVGTHIGLLSKDTNFKILKWEIYTGSQNAMVNCLSIPDAFLACKEFKKAYVEYQRIAESFKGRTEGREALFRSGITLLEEAKIQEVQAERYYLCDLANNEFEKLRNTNGAPLEYLGKSLIYKFLQDIEEETKCLELAIRKFPKNPLLSLIKEEMTFRLHECAKISRSQTYLFALLAIRYIQPQQMQKETKNLIQNIHEHLDLLFFQTPFSQEKIYLHIAICLAFWLNKSGIILEIAHAKITTPEEKIILLTHCSFTLLFLHHEQSLKDLITSIESDDSQIDWKISSLFSMIKEVAFSKKSSVQLVELITKNPSLHANELKLLKYIVSFKLFDCTILELEKIYSILAICKTHDDLKKEFDLLLIEILLRAKKFAECKSFFETYATELKHPISPFYTLYGIYLYAHKDEKELIEECKKLFQLPHPPICALFAHYLSGYISTKSSWYQKCFFYEKLQLYRQLELLAAVKGKRSKQLSFEKKIWELINSQNS